MLTGVLFAAVIVSFCISLAAWRSPSLWPLQVFAGALLLALDYWLLRSGIGFVTSAIALVQIGRGYILSQRRRAAKSAPLTPAPDTP
jgi:hypothetical protein